VLIVSWSDKNFVKKEQKKMIVGYYPINGGNSKSSKEIEELKQENKRKHYS